MKQCNFYVQFFQPRQVNNFRSLLRLWKNLIVKQPIKQSIPSRSSADSTFSALRHRNFQLYFGGQLISNIGTWMQIIAQGWVVYQIGHSELTLGLVAFASAIPVLVISPWGGVIVDRVSRRNLLIATQTGAMLLAFILAALTFTGVVKEWHVIVLAALLGVVNAFDAPARQAFVPEMVGKKDLPNAIALNSIMFNSARVIGPAIAGLTLAVVGAAWCFTTQWDFLFRGHYRTVANEITAASGCPQSCFILATIGQWREVHGRQPRNLSIDPAGTGI